MQTIVKAFIKTTFIPFFNFTGIIPIVNKIGRLRRKKIVLNYHNIKPQILDEHLKYLTKRFHIGKPEDLFKSENEGMILLTFDDGYKSFIYEIQEILKKYKAYATLFIPTCIFDGNAIFYFDLLKILIEKRKKDSVVVNKKQYKINKNNEVTVLTEISIYLKKISTESRQEILSSIQSQLMSVLDDKDKESYRLMNINDIKKIDDELVTIGAHGITHELLSRLTNKELEYEIKHSKEILEKITGRPVQYFAYPSGAYTVEATNILQSYGFKAAFTTREGYFSDENAFEINRIPIDDNLSVHILALKISPILKYFRYLEKIIQNKGNMNVR